MNNNQTKKDNFYFVKNILWYDIDKGGYIKGSLNKQAAVYIFKGISNETRYYVGSSINLRSRLSTHRSCTINEYNKDALSILYNSVRKYGWNSFKFGILEYLDFSNIMNTKKIKNIILEREQFYIDNINPSLNTCKIAHTPLGVKRDISFSLNLSRAKRGKSIRSAIIVNTRSNTISSDTRLKLSSGSPGVKVKIFDKSNNLINEFPTLTSAAKYLNVCRKTIRDNVKKGIYYDNYTYKIEENKKQFIVVVDKENNTIKKYHSIRSAAKDIGISHSNLLPYINTNKLFRKIYLIFRK